MLRGILLAVLAVPFTLQAQSVVPGAPVTVTTIGDTIPSGVGGVTVDRLGFVYVADFMENVWKISRPEIEPVEAPIEAR